VSGPDLDPLVSAVLRVCAALLFVSAALHKLRRPGTFRAALAGYRLLPQRALPAATGLLAGLELAVGCGCAVPALAPAACLGGVALLGVYTGAIGINLLRGRAAIDCGCAGPGGPRPLGPELALRNALLAGLLLVAALPVGSRELVWLDAVSGTGLLAGLVLLYAAADVALANAARLRDLEAGA
jgi:hypothetical protein